MLPCRYNRTLQIELTQPICTLCLVKHPVYNSTSQTICHNTLICNEKSAQPQCNSLNTKTVTELTITVWHFKKAGEVFSLCSHVMCK
jgi:hypothetical protein